MDRPLTALWLDQLYGAGHFRPRPVEAERTLQANPDLIGADPYLACAVGDLERIQNAIRESADWVQRPGGPRGMSPLVAVTHSALVQRPGFAGRLLESARILIAAGAGVNQPWRNPEHPQYPLSPLYGAAGLNLNAAMTQLLLESGANPNDNESLYHSLNASDLTCTRLLLAAGAKVPGTNALARVLDFDCLEGLRLLLAAGGNPNEATNVDAPIHHAIRRYRSLAHIQTLLDAGADPQARTREGATPFQLANRFGMPDVAALLASLTGEQLGAPADLWIAACARGDEATARAILREHPSALNLLNGPQLRSLPDLVQAGNFDGAKLMVTLGWPLDARGGDWNASALNLAVFRGDPDLTRFLLQHGASWKEEHGFHDNVMGTLSYASREEPVPGGNWLACAQELLAHGMPVPPPKYIYPESISKLFAAHR